MDVKQHFNHGMLFQFLRLAGGGGVDRGEKAGAGGGCYGDDSAKQRIVQTLYNNT